MMPKPLPKPKPHTRLKEVRKLTIAAAFLCRDGLVLCADTEETRGEMKFQVPKLVVLPEGQGASKRKAVFAGAGAGAFIDKLVEEMWSAGQFAEDGIDSMVEAMEDACIRVHRRYWEIFPAEERPEAHILFGLVEGGEVRLYKATGPIVNRISTYELTGSGDPLARYIASRASASLSVKDAVGLSVYLLGETKKFVSGCGGDSHIAVLNLDGSHETIADNRVLMIGLTIGQLQDQMWALLGPLTDHEMEERKFEAALYGATEQLRGIRRNDEGLLQMAVKVAAIATHGPWTDTEREDEDGTLTKAVKIAIPRKPRKRKRPT